MGDEGNTCPECDGYGVVEGECVYWSYWTPPEYDEKECPVCGGTGIITEPVSEEDVA